MMNRVLFILTLTVLTLTACAPASGIGAIIPPYIDTGVDPDSWVLVPAGDFPYGQHDHMTPVDHDYEIMVTDVTNAQYARFLNDALAGGTIQVGEVEMEAGEQVTVHKGIYAYYPGEPFDGYEHEEEIKPGDKLYVPFEEGLRLTLDEQANTFTAIPEYANHPMTLVSWFGANAYCQCFAHWSNFALDSQTILWYRNFVSTSLSFRPSAQHPCQYSFYNLGHNCFTHFYCLQNRWLLLTMTSIWKSANRFWPRTRSLSAV